MWQSIWNTVLSEFSDIPDATQITRITVRLLVAALLGGLLGYEREQRGKSAGVRTHMLVAIGAALFVLIPQQAGATAADLTRVLQGLIAGVGFLGAGAIISGTKQVETRGLTTAAGLFRKAADQGFAEAENNLGVLYANGEGVKKDLKQAKKWFEKAAAQGHPAAQRNLERLQQEKR